MNSLIFQLWAIILLAVCATGGNAQDKIYFEHYTTENGLSDNYITSIAQDERGYIWCGTQYGLNRYDGGYFKIFTHSSFGKLLRNDIACLAIDSAGALLAGAGSGVIVRYNQGMDDFDNKSICDAYGTEFASILHFCKTGKDRLYALTTSGLYVYNTRLGVFSNTLPVFDSVQHLIVNALYIDRNGNYWIGTRSGLYVFDCEGRERAVHQFSTSKKADVSALLLLNDSTLLVTTFNCGIWKLPLATGNHLPKPQEWKTPFPEAGCLMRDSRQRLWIGTRSHGLWYMDESGHFTCIQPYQTQNTEMKAVNCLYEDQRHNVWAGTQGTGLWCYKPSLGHAVNSSKTIGFPSTIVSSFGQDKAGNLWVGTDGDGVFILSPRNELLSQLRISNGLPSNGVLSIARGKGNDFWAATWGGGVAKINGTSRSVQSWHTGNSSLPLNETKTVCVTPDNTVWAGTHGEGICQLDTRTNQWLSYRNSPNKAYELKPYPWVNQIVAAEAGTMWIATIRNLWRMDGDSFKIILADTGNVPLHQPLFVHALAADARGSVFIATNRGVYAASSRGAKVNFLGYLPAGEYVSAVVDHQNRCWLAGTNGIVRAGKSAKDMSVLTLPPQCYKGNYFTPRASFVDSQGRVYFGAVDGFLSFHPDSLNQTDDIESVSFADLYISSDKVLPGTSPLAHQLSSTDTLCLQYDQTNIRIGFDAVCFTNTGELQCAYRLEGLDTAWIALGQKRELSFSQLPPGTYRLAVRAWKRGTGKQTSIVIQINPPYWKTWWFRLLAIVTVAGMLFMLITIRLRRIVKQNVQLEKMVQERTAALVAANDEIANQNKTLSEKQFVIQIKNEELSHTLETKDRLISIIAHDLKNPMAAIVGLLEVLHRGFDRFDEPKKKNLVGTVLDSSKTLQNEMLNLLAWASAQLRNISFSPTDTNLQVVILDTIALLRETASDKAIAIQLEHKAANMAYVDARMISTVMRNLLGNAIKFTPRNGHIVIKTMQTDSTVQITIQDWGVGMTAQQMETIFTPAVFNSTYGTNKEKGTGLGLKICHEFVAMNNGTIRVESTAQQGTCFTICLPMGSAGEHEPTAEEKSHAAVPKIVLEPSLLEGNTILIIDDNPLIRQHLQHLIGAYTTVLEAADGEAGLAMAQEQQPDIILSDVDMPLMDGFQMCKAVSANPATAHIPVVLLTAKSEALDRLRGLSNGAVDYLTKPFDETELLIKLSNILFVRRSQQQRLLAQKREGEASPEKINPFLEKLLGIIESEYKNPGFTIEELAQSVAMSRSTLSRKLGSIIDKTPIELLNEHRLHRARHLLQTAQRPVAEVAYEVGFSDPFYFSRKFKEFFGETPSQVHK